MRRCSPRATRSAHGSPRCGASLLANTVSSFRRSNSPTTSRRRREPIRSRFHGTAVATQELRVRDHLIIIGDGPRPNLPGDEVREPAFGIRAIAIPEAFVKDARRSGFKPVDPVSVLLTHLSEVIHNNLAQLLSYKDMRALLDRLEPEYKRLLDDICPSQISQSTLLATLKLLLAERVSIRNLSLILEAVAEVAPHARRPEQIAEQVRIRLSQQICGDLADDGALAVLNSAIAGISPSTKASSATPRAT